MAEKPLHKIWWLWVPLLFFIMQLALEFTLPSDVLSVMLSENGPHESLQFLIMATAFLLSVFTLIKMDRKCYRWPALWVGLAALCSLYVAGEEVSWGQHIFDWATPEFWLEHNDQAETNLHNTSSWLDQKPRLVLLMGTVAGGLIIPFLLRVKPSLVPQQFSVIYPPAMLGVTAAFAIGINLLDKLDEALDSVVIFERSSEVEELYLFYFVLLYLIVLRRRLVQDEG